MEVQRVEAEIRDYKPYSDDLPITNCYYISKANIARNLFKLYYNSNPRTRVFILYFEECSFVEFPRSEILLDLVENLTSLTVTNCKLKSISREDLRGLGALKDLYFDINEITRLPKELFEHTPNLEIISFHSNKIKEIDADILEPLQHLKYFNLMNNVAISVKYDSIKGTGNVTLEQLKEEIKKCDPIEKFKAEMRKEVATLKDGMRKENETLKRKLDEVEKTCKDQEAEIKRLKENPIVSDFTVKVNGKDFRVNKEMLTTNSPLLARMINENQNADQLELHDLSEETFEEILKYMRSKNPPDNAANFIELFAVSSRLEMKELKDLTAVALMDKVTFDNALKIMVLCEKFGHDELPKKAFKELQKKFAD